MDDLRALAKERKRPLRRVLEEVIQKGLTAPDRAQERIEIETFPVGIKPAYRGMSMNQLYDQIEAEETQRVAES